MHDRTNAQSNHTACNAQYTASHDTTPHNTTTQHSIPPYLARPLRSDRLVGLYRDGFRVRPKGGDAHGRAAATAKRRRRGGQCLRTKTRSSLLADEAGNVTRPLRLGRRGGDRELGRGNQVGRSVSQENKQRLRSIRRYSSNTDQTKKRDARPKPPNRCNSWCRDVWCDFGSGRDV